MTGKPSGLASHTAQELKQIIAAERTGMPFLIWRRADGSLQITYLEKDHWRLTIGRAEDADIALTDDSQVSRTHALIERVGGAWTLLDDGLSRNGSFANATRRLGPALRARVLSATRAGAGPRGRSGEVRPLGPGDRGLETRF